tara:strand:- start:3051 stop:4523 length:1473 start_codon:yes stop_codon:yes gene_type:complete
MASTYRSPETVVVSEAGPAVKILDSFSNNFVKAASNIVKINNEKVKKTRAEQAALVKSIYIDPEKFLERLQKAGAEEQEYKLFNDLLDKNANMQLKIEAGLFDKSDYKYLMSEKNKTLTQLNSMVGLAADGTAKSVKYKENYLDNSKNLSRQGFQSALDNDYISAMNIYSGTNPTNAFETYFQGDTQMIKFSGKEFEKGEYTIPLKSLLAYEPMMVPEFNKEVTDLATGRLLEKDGSLTKVAKGMTEEDYLGEWSDIINTVTKGYAGNLPQIKSFALEVIGMEQDDIFSLDINTRIPGTEISDEALLKTMQTANKWAKDTMLIPKHIYEPPKPDEPSASDKAYTRNLEKLSEDSNTWQTTFGEKKGLFNIGKNKEGGVFVGKVKIFKDAPDPENPNKTIRVLDENFIRALNNIGPGYSVKSTPGDAGIEAIIQGGTSGGTLSIVDGDNAINFIEKLFNYEFKNYKGYKTQMAKDYAQQFINAYKPTLPGS